MIAAHVAKSDAYVAHVLSGEVPACKWVRKACQRHVDDLAKSAGADWPFVFDPAKAEKVCAFVSKLPHVKGRWARKDPKTGKPSRLVLEPWQCWLISMLFGWVKKANGMRRFRRASVYVPRKNSKSTLASGIGWYMFAKDDEPGAEVYAGATSEKQAWEVFGLARQMGISEPHLPAGTGATINARSIIRPAENSKFEPVIGKPGDGASPHLAIIDEYHEHADSSHHDTMKTGMGAREQPLLLIISTAGESLAGPCRDDWAECEKILDGVIEDESKFCVIWTIDSGDDWTTEAALRKANPNWGVSVNPEVILPDQQIAIRDATKQAIFKIKHLDVWVGARGGWLNMEQWKANADPKLKIDQFRGREAWIGLDAASKIDMTSMVATVRHENGYATFAKHYIPEDTAALPQNAQYRKWIADGWLTATPGGRVDFTVIEDDLKAWADLLNVQSLAFDPKELNDFVNRVGLWASFERVEVTQGAAIMSEPMKEMEALIAVRKYRHNGDPVLGFMASNVIRKEARGGGPVKYYYPTKAKPENKIDGIVAGIMALSRAMKVEEGAAPGFAFV